MLLVFALFISTAFGAERVSLDSLVRDGTWTVRNSNGSIKAAAQVPGGIYTDLSTAGFLQQDIFYRFNDMEYRWVARDNWTYSRSFRVTQKFTASNQLLLVMNGLDTVAKVFVNGKQIGNCDNMFVRYEFPIKDIVKADEDNELVVHFESPIAAARKRYEEQEVHYPVLPKCVPPQYNGECHVNHLRKMQASFSWDWGPAFPSVGIWKSVVLEAFNAAALRDVTINTRREGESWVIQATAFLVATQNLTQGTLQLQLDLGDGQFLWETNNVKLVVDKNGNCNATINMTVPGGLVELWWPNGYGDQKLYKLLVSFYSPNMEEVDFKHLTIGFRTIDLIQKPVPIGDGLTFYFRVNDIPIFAKGSNWIPSHILPEISAKEETLNHLLVSSKAVHMNMLRVWGGGIYESDMFYELADRLGILIWQDFMFACSMYPKTVDFLNSVASEVEQQVRRLQHHASIAIWAGNNENEAALRGNWYGTYSNFSLFREDYIVLYVDTMRPIVHINDPTRPYVVSSPTNAKKSEEEGYIANDPYSPLYGDIHYYNYLADGWDPNVYPYTRFSSEYGFQSMPSLQAFSAISEPQDWALDSEFVEHRQHHPAGYLEMKLEIGRHIEIPSEALSHEGFHTFIYLSQINQAMSVKTETEFYRRGRGLLALDGEGFTMGALYWQLNDVWQAPSWSSIEFGGQWKMLHYFAKHFFAPVIVSPAMTPMGNLQVTLISDLVEDIPGVSLEVSAFNWASLKAIPVLTNNYTLNATSANRVLEFNIEQILPHAECGGPEDPKLHCFLYFTLKRSNNSLLAPPNFLFPMPLKNAIGIKRANITINTITLGSENDTFHLELNSDNIALFVWLESYHIAGIFSDNGFLMVEKKVTIDFVTSENVTVQQVKQSLVVTSLADIM